MRLDLWLKLSRLVPRRSGAKDLCEAGDIFVDGTPAKAGREVRPGDRLLLRLSSRELEVEVLEVPAGRSVSKQVARTIYRVVGERRFDLWGNEAGNVPGSAPHGGEGPP